MSATNEIAPPDARTSVAARAVGLTKTYGEGDAAVRALDDVTVEFERARFTAIMGPSGSGKSTLLHCMAGLDTPTSGQVLIGDVDLTTLSEKRPDAAAAQQRRLRVPGLQPGAHADGVRRTSRSRSTSPGEGARRGLVRRGGRHGRARRSPLAIGRPSSPGGQQQRVAGARALVSRPEIVFADEPTGNLDSKAGQEILAFLRSAVNDHGQTIVMVTHDASAASFADRIVFLADGRVVDEMLEPTTERVLDRLKSLEG